MRHMCVCACLCARACVSKSPPVKGIMGWHRWPSQFTHTQTHPNICVSFFRCCCERPLVAVCQCRLQDQPYSVAQSSRKQQHLSRRRSRNRRRLKRPLGSPTYRSKNNPSGSGGGGAAATPPPGSLVFRCLV